MHVAATYVGRANHTPQYRLGVWLDDYNEYAQVCAMVVNYCSCVLNKIMPPKGGSERSELATCIL